MYELGLNKNLHVKNIICDICDNSCHDGENQQYLTLQGLFGFGSKKDDELHRCHICEDCYDKKVRPFLESIGKIRVTHLGLLDSETPNFQPHLDTTEGRFPVDIDEHLGEEGKDYILKSDIDPNEQKT